ncbi:MAG: ASPIC/UnbV domain-containing protein [Gemmataceae bacterium]
MSQPCDRACTIPAPGQVDKSLGEFWVENPWEIVKNGHNLSCFERNRTWMNIKGSNFIDLSFLTGTDNDGDGRCVVAGDFSNNGRQDLLVRQVGGGPLLLYENNFPQRHYLKVSLRGSQSNRLGVGARLTALVKGQQLVREMFPINSYRSQMPNLVHFGLADAEQMERLEIRWPSGKIQVLTDLKGDKHIVVDEGKDGAAAIESVVPGQTIRP